MVLEHIRKTASGRTLCHPGYTTYDKKDEEMKKSLRILLLTLAILTALSIVACKPDGGTGNNGPTPVTDCSAGHTYDNDCDRICNVCEERRSIEHVYDNDCDTDCNVCGIPHTPAHSFDGDCDGSCNNCSFTRDPKHTFVSDCDTTCENCDFVRTVSHFFDNGCDTTCNNCTYKREQNPHVYTDDCDTDCNECEKTRLDVPHLDSDNNGSCDLCGEVLFITTPADKFDLPELPIYDGVNTYVSLNGGTPFFLHSQITTESYEFYSQLDSLGRCGVAVGCLGTETLAEGGRDFSLSGISPSGWYGNSIYERCHLIAYSLSGETTNRQNLITGTCLLNNVMQEFEAMVTDYIKDTKNHVMYRTTPVFEGDNLVASGVILEAYSVEDNGDGITFCIYIHNVQTDYVIDYATGIPSVSPDAAIKLYKFVINASNYKIHLSTCRHVSGMSEANKIYANGTAQEVYNSLVAEGKAPTYCGTCKPQNAARQILFIIPEKRLANVILTKKHVA